MFCIDIDIRLEIIPGLELDLKDSSSFLLRGGGCRGGLCLGGVVDIAAAVLAAVVAVADPDPGPGPDSIPTDPR